MSSPAAGWYKDPDPSGDGQRYWDGVIWTQDVRPVPDSSTDTAPSVAPGIDSEGRSSAPEAASEPYSEKPVRLRRSASPRKRPTRASYGKPLMATALALAWAVVSLLSIMSARGTLNVPFLP